VEFSFRLAPRTFFLCLAVLTVAATVQSCDEHSASEAGDIARLDEMEAEILDYIGTPTCRGSGDCAIIAFGAKPCGGPWRYLIYSKSTVDSTTLAGMVRVHHDLNVELNRKWGWRSTCDLARKPEVACVDGTCVDTSGTYDDVVP